MVVIAALMDKLPLIATVAPLVLYARIAQSLSHLLGTSFVLVMARATFFLAQIGMTFWMAIKLL